MYQIVAYIKFFFRSIKFHGVHSPFVFNLVTQCFKDKTTYPEYKILNDFNKKLRKDNNTILVKDFGTGSRIFHSNHRKVSAIAKHAGISKKRQHMLFRLSKYLQFENTLELGTSLGKATLALALNTNNHIVSIEGCTATALIAVENLKQVGCKNIKIRNSTFDDALKTPLDFSPDCVYIDGNHNKKDTLNYFEKLLPQIHNDTVLIFDDIYWSKEMTQAWKKIAQHHRVTVSIDTFFWGLVFFRKEQEKQEFTIRV